MSVNTESILKQGEQLKCNLSAELQNYLKKRKLDYENTDLTNALEFSHEKNEQCPCLAAKYENGAMQFIFPHGEKLFAKDHTYKGFIWKHNSFTWNQPVFVVESVICALSLIQSGHNAVATGSANNSPKNFFRRIPVNSRIILAYDNDIEGRKAMKRDYKYLNIVFTEYDGVTVKIALSPKKDWNDVLCMEVSNT